MPRKLNVPHRAKPILDDDGSPNDRLDSFFREIPSIADAQSSLTLTFSTHAPTATTAQTIADGSSPTVAEIGQFMKNQNEILTNLIAKLKAAGVISS